MYGAPLCMTHSTNFKLPKCGYMSPGAPSYCQPQIPQIVKNSVAQKPGGCCTHKMVIGHMCHPMIFVGSSSFIPMIHPHDSSHISCYMLLVLSMFHHILYFNIFYLVHIQKILHPHHMSWFIWLQHTLTSYEPRLDVSHYVWFFSHNPIK